MCERKLVGFQVLGRINVFQFASTNLGRRGRFHRPFEVIFFVEMVQFNMLKRSALVCLLILAVVGGVILYLNQTGEDGPTLLVNKNEPIDYKTHPASFKVVSPGLLSRPIEVGALANDGRMKFEKLTGTGIKFKNSFDRSKPMELLDTGSGIAIGDYDNDGLQDIYLVGGEIANKLYRNLGDFKFEDVTIEAGVDGRRNGRNLYGSGASFADVDNDGDLDLYVCNMAAPNMLFINQGDGTFSEQAFYRDVAYSGASKIANFCDYDQDGDLDFYLVTYQDRQPDRSVDPVVIVDGKRQIREDMIDQYAIVGEGVVKTGQRDLLFRNNGDGTFEDVTDSAGVADYGTTLSAIWFDFDGDGWQDIYASNDFHAPDRLYRNNGDGTFRDVLPEVVRHTPWFSMGSDFGDLNNDGLLDFMTADMSGTSHYKRKVDMGDMGDSAFFLTYGRPRQYMKNCLNINSGMGPFFEIASMAGMSSTDWTWAVRFVDMDNDGKLDVYITNGHARDMMNADTAGKLDALIAKNASQEEIDKFYCNIPAKREANLAFQNRGELDFLGVGPAWNLNHVGVSHGAAFADFDNDGDQDLVVNNYYEPSLIYRNDSQNGSRTLFEFRCGDNNFFGYGTKLEIWQDGKYQTRTLNPVRGYISSDPAVLHFGSDTAETIQRVKVTWPDQTVEEFENLAPNRMYRIVESESRSPATQDIPPNRMFEEVSQEKSLVFKHIERPYDDFQRENLLPYKMSELGGGLAWGDVNGDGFPDLFCGGAAGQAGALFLNQGGQSFARSEGPWAADAECEDMGMLFFDADGDGDIDLYVVSGGNECEPGDEVLIDRLYLNDGEGNFEKSDSSLPDNRDSGSSVAAADYDRDGDLDLFIGSRAIPGKYPLTPTSRLLQNDGGVFKDVTRDAANPLLEVGLVNSAVWSDVNGDRWIDLVIALDWGPVTIMFNEQGTFVDKTTELKLDDHRGWWHGLTAADLDQDGDIDFVVTNQGMNTKYHADPEHPHRLYYSDFDESGTLDLVETEFEGGIEYPARGLSCSSNSMPFIGEKFESYHDYASASLLEIYEPSIKEKPFHEVNFLASAILWNQGDAFEVQSLPRMAQASPGFGVTVADFNGDARPDIFLANNFFASQPETGFMDGGLSLLLLGRGERAFDVIWPNKSGVVINDASYGAAMADFDRDGDLDIAVSTNNSSLRLLENRAEVERATKIRLVGSMANANAIGARIELNGEGFTQVIDVQSGGGYQSQTWTGEVVVSQETVKKVTSVEIRWPDGTESTHDFKPEANGVLELTK